MKGKKRAPERGKPKAVGGEHSASKERPIERETAPETKRTIEHEQHRNAERSDTMASSNESKSAEQVGGSISQEVEREAKGISTWSAPAAEGASPPPAAAAPQSGVDAVMSAIMAMSDLGERRKATEETAASAESAVQSALANSAKVVGARPE